DSPGRLAMIDETAAAGGRVYGQTECLGLNIVLSFLTQLPFDKLPVWTEFRALPIEQQKHLLRTDAELRRRPVASAEQGDPSLNLRVRGPVARPADFDLIEVYNTPLGPNPTVAELAAERRTSPVDLMLDLSLEKDFKQFFLQGGIRNSLGKLGQDVK